MGESRQKKGGCLGKLFGCGCLLLIVGLVAAGAASWWGYQQAMALMKSVESLDASRIEELRREVVPELTEFNQEKVVEAVREPLGTSDVDRFLETTEWFHAQPEYQSARQTLEAVPAREGSEVDMELLVSLKEIFEANTELLGLMKRLNQHVGERGGFGAQLESALRVVRVAISAESVAKQLGEEPWSDKVAAEVLRRAESEEAGGTKDGRTASVDALKDALGLEGEELERADEALRSMAKLPVGSAKTWKALDKARRREVVEAYREQGEALLATKVHPLVQTAPILKALLERAP